MPEDVPNIAQQQIRALSEKLVIALAQRDEAREAHHKCQHDLKRLEAELRRTRTHGD